MESDENRPMSDDRFEMRDALYFAGLLMLMIGFTLLHEAAGFIAVGAVLTYTALRRPPATWRDNTTEGKG